MKILIISKLQIYEENAKLVFSHSLHSILLISASNYWNSWCSICVSLYVYTCICIGRHTCMYVHAWINEWCVCMCIFMHISSLAVCAQFDSVVACDHRSIPPGCTIPALILLPMKIHLFPLPPAYICQHSHIWHLCLCTYYGWQGLGFYFFNILTCDLCFNYLLKWTDTFSFCFYLFFSRSSSIFCSKYVCIFRLWDSRSSPKYKACELEVFELRMWLFYCL